MGPASVLQVAVEHQAVSQIWVSEWSYPLYERSQPMLGFNDTLNNIIAVVVVILILSLVVQSVQSLVKKLFKIKSRQIEESLVDLFTNLLNKTRVQPDNWLDTMIDHSPMWRVLVFWRKPPTAAQRAGVEDILDTVVRGFKDVGRVAQSGKHMLDSIAKGDLLKILEKVPIRDLLPSFAQGVEDAFRDIADLQQVITEVKDAASNGAANNAFQTIADDFISMELLLAPVFSDVQAILEADKFSIPDAPKSPPDAEETRVPNVLVRDLTHLTEIHGDKLQKLLDDMRKAVSEAKANVSADPKIAQELGDLEAGLHRISATLVSLRLRLSPAVTAFREKTKEASQWYDIVMQSFEERYNRSMKSCAVVIAFMVVAMMNANFFNIYRNIASSEVTRNLLVDKGSDVLKLTHERNAGTDSNQAGTQAGDSSSANQPGNQPAAPIQNQLGSQPASGSGAAPPSLSPTGPAKPIEGLTADQKAAQAEREQVQQTRNELNEAIQLIKSDADLYKGIGFTPLRVQQVKDFFSSLTPDKNLKHPWDGWIQARKHDIKALLGWIIMTILLSIGAPFWQDTLESLFGVKNLLRTKGDIKNVEEESGTGQPKP